MKKPVSVLLLVVLLISFAAPGLTPTAQAGFADDWLASTTAAGPDYAQGQKRGYMTGGSFSARWQPATDPYILSLQKPKISAGCGGIDIFMGGFSFLGFDYLVKKFQAILMNAPALAFDLALKALAEQASNSIKGLDNLTNALNILQQDDCAIASNLVGKFSETEMWQTGMQKAKTGVETAIGAISFWNKGAENTVANKGELKPDEAKQTVSGCGAEMKSLFLGQDPVTMDFGGALFLDRIGSSARMKIPSSYIPFIRGLIGDIKIGAASEGFKPLPVARCAENSTSKLDDIINGKAHTQDQTGKCTPTTDVNANLYQFAMDRTSNVLSAVKNKQPIDTDEWDFIKSTPVPVLEAAKLAVATGQESAIMPQIARLAAHGMALNLLMDLNDRISFAIQKGLIAFTVSAGANTASAPETCSVSAIEGPIKEQLKEMKGNLVTMIDAVSTNYNNVMSEAQTSFAFVNQFQQVKSSLKTTVSQVFGTSFANRVMNK